MDTTKSELRLSDLVEREHAEEIAEKHIPKTFVWKRKKGGGMDSEPPKWMVEAMIEFKNEANDNPNNRASEVR